MESYEADDPSIKALLLILFKIGPLRKLYPQVRH